MILAFFWGFWLGVACEYLRQRLAEERRAQKRIRDAQMTAAFERDFGATAMSWSRN